MPPRTPHCQHRKALERGEWGFAIGDWSGWGNSRRGERRRSESRAASGLGFRAPPVVSLQRLSSRLSLLRRAPLRSCRLKTEKSFRVQAPFLFCFFVSGPTKPKRVFNFPEVQSEARVFNNWHHDSRADPHPARHAAPPVLTPTRGPGGCVGSSAR